MAELNQLLVRRIKEGTVIDHIDPGKAFNVLKTLNVLSVRKRKAPKILITRASRPINQVFLASRSSAIK